MQIKSMGFTL